MKWPHALDHERKSPRGDRRAASRVLVRTPGFRRGARGSMHSARAISPSAEQDRSARADGRGRPARSAQLGDDTKSNTGFFLERVHAVQVLPGAGTRHSGADAEDGTDERAGAHLLDSPAPGVAQQASLLELISTTHRASGARCSTAAEVAESHSEMAIVTPCGPPPARRRTAGNSAPRAPHRLGDRLGPQRRAREPRVR